MSDSPAFILREAILSEGIGSRPEDGGSWPFFVAFLPDDDSPSLDNAIAVFNTSPVLEGRIQRTGKTVLHPGISILVRSTSEVNGWNKAEEIKDFLDSVRRKVVIGSETYILHAATLSSGIIALGEVESRSRRAFSLNALLTISTV